jgi:rare lipoprotein A (peptidoglycan hydrolase)
MKRIITACAIIALLITINLIKIKPNEAKIVSSEVKPTVTPKPTSTPTPTPTYLHGKASFYNRTICPLHNTTYGENCFNRDGTLFDDTAMSSACFYDWLGEEVRVCHEGKCIQVICRDTGAFKEKYGRILDLSENAFSKLSPLSRGVINVKVERIK